MQRFFPATLATRLFGAVSLSDLARYRSANERGKLHQDVASLNAQELVRPRRLMASKGREKSSFIVLTKAGEPLRRQPSQQAFYAALVKPQEAAHDAAIYRMYQAEARSRRVLRRGCERGITLRPRSRMTQRYPTRRHRLPEGKRALRLSWRL
jgi:hypothetical protein